VFVYFVLNCELTLSTTSR